MKLSDVVRAVRPSIVAFMPMYRVSLSPSSPPDEHPPIIGTEFIVHERGLVVTNHHVYEALRQLPRPPDAPAGEWPAVAVLFHEITKAKYPKAATDGYAAIPLGIAGVLKELQLSKEAIYYGPRRPDIALVHVKVTGLPALELLADHSAIEVGAEVGTLGYPMGREALIAPGWVHQIGPFLQTGIVSAVLPFPGAEPHRFVFDILSRGGASGSPVFLTSDPRPIGILYGGLNDIELAAVRDDNKKMLGLGVVRVPTSLSYAVPAHVIGRCIEFALAAPEFAQPPDGSKSLDELIQQSELVVVKKRGTHPEPPQLGRIAVTSADAAVPEQMTVTLHGSGGQDGGDLH